MTRREAGDVRANLLVRHMTLVHDRSVSEVYVFPLCMHVYVVQVTVTCALIAC